MSGRRRLGILGGTLDPIHVGHLEVADAARRALSLDTVLILPARIPPHRSDRPHASSYHRFAMVALATSGRSELIASDLELRSDGPSYTSDTLGRLHELGFEPEQLFFITGADAFADIASWHDYPRILDACHFVVVSRPAHPVATLSARLPALAGRMRQLQDWEPADGPAVILVDWVTPAVSSTDIRRRLAEGESIAGLVPDAVGDHILRHRLYAPTPVGSFAP